MTEMLISEVMSDKQHVKNLYLSKKYFMKVKQSTA